MLITTLLISFQFVIPNNSTTDVDYLVYHSQTNEILELVTEERYDEAIDKYEKLFTSYDFIFSRDYKIASQLAYQAGDIDNTFKYIELGIKGGWTWKSLKKHPFFESLHKHEKWLRLEQDYEELHQVYVNKLNKPLRKEVHTMLKADQRKALGAFVRFTEKWQKRYILKTFVPHSEQQMAKMKAILNEANYPGERLIGNSFWASTIISHHNSIDPDYNRKDTLYKNMQPLLIKNLKSGYLSPSEYAVIDDWRISIINESEKIGYGFLTEVKSSTLEKTNNLRTAVGLPTIELRNKLARIEKEKGMNFYMTDWLKGAIKILPD